MELFKLVTISLLFTIFCTPVYSESIGDIDTELFKIKAEKSKIEKYIKSGISNNEIKKVLKELKTKEISLIKKRKSMKSTIKKSRTKREKALVTENAQKQSNSKDQISDQLNKDKTTLKELEDLISNGADPTYFKSAISKLKSAITVNEQKISYFKSQSSPTETMSPKVKVDVGAILDFYYLYTSAAAQKGDAVDGRAYAADNNDFTMNLFELNFSAQMEQTTLHADLDFGNFAEVNSGHDKDKQNHNIGQAYLEHQISDSLTFAAGKMYTHVGYEVAKAIDNWNYSRSWAFTNGGPFWHEGISLIYTNPNGFSSGLYVYDSWDSTAENNSEKSYGLQLKYSDDKFSFIFNYNTDSQNAKVGLKTSVYEFNTQYQINDSLAIALNGVSGISPEALTDGTDALDKKWQAWVLYLHWDATDKWSFTPRFESFKDDSDKDANDNIFSSTKPATITSATFTSAYKVNGNSEIRLEYRADSSGEELWTDDDGEAAKEMNTLSAAWLFSI